MPSKKRRGRVRFSPAMARRKLSSDWAENLADSNKGLILRPGAMAEGVERAAKHRMRPVGRPAIIAAERLHEKINKSVA